MPFSPFSIFYAILAIIDDITIIAIIAVILIFATPVASAAISTFAEPAAIGFHILMLILFDADDIRQRRRHYFHAIDAMPPPLLPFFHFQRH